MSEREDWFADSEGNLTPPAESGEGGRLRPDTDEFGRDDPVALEREARRREREARRRGRTKPPRKQKHETGERGGLLGGLRRRREPEPEEAAPPAQAAEPQQAAPEPQQAAPAPQQAAPARQAPATPPTEVQPTASRREVLRERLSRAGRGGEPPGDEGGSRRGRSGGFRRRRIIAV